MKKIMTAHQPNFLPYLGFFDKMVAVHEMGTESGVFVLREDCQFVNKDFHHRNRIRNYESWQWLHLPVEKSRNPIDQIPIKVEEKISQVPWNEYHLRLITQLYKKALYFDDFYPELEEIYSKPSNNLAEFNIRLIKYLIESFDIKTKVISIYDLPSSVRTDDPSKTLKEIAKALDADTYLSGDGGKDYMDLSYFKDGVQVVFQNYKHPVYPQRFPGFQPNMSAIDALFCIGRLPRSGDTVN
jgi:hypothetical protein